MRDLLSNSTPTQFAIAVLDDQELTDRTIASQSPGDSSSSKPELRPPTEFDTQT